MAMMEAGFIALMMEAGFIALMMEAVRTCGTSISKSLHGATSQKDVFFILAAIRN
jgi:hypothetical protein